PSGSHEVIMLILTGALIGGSLCLLRPLVACGAGITLALGTGLGAICLSYWTNYWFPWLIVAAGQIPFAVALAFVPVKATEKTKTAVQSTTAVLPEQFTLFPRPQPPGYKLFEPPLGEGGFGQVWLAQNAIGQWQAVKAVYRAKFRDDWAYGL